MISRQKDKDQKESPVLWCQLSGQFRTCNVSVAATKSLLWSCHRRQSGELKPVRDNWSCSLLLYIKALLQHCSTGWWAVVVVYKTWQLQLSQLSSPTASKMARLLVSSSTPWIFSLSQNKISSSFVFCIFKSVTIQLTVAVLAFFWFIFVDAVPMPFNAQALPGGWHYNGDVARSCF